MADSQVCLSEFQGMWLFVLFDLPVTNKRARKHYAQFRKYLLKEGFSMLQFSIYARYFRSEDRSKPIKRNVKERIPPDGRVRLLLVTDHQFSKMECFFGKKQKQTEESPAQLLLF